MFWQPLSVPIDPCNLVPRIALLLWSFWLTNCPSCMLPLWWIRFTSCTTRSPILSPRKSFNYTHAVGVHAWGLCIARLVCVCSVVCVSLDFARYCGASLSSLGSSMRPLVWSGHLCGSFVMVWSSEVWSAHLCGSFVMVWSAAWCPWYSCHESVEYSTSAPRALDVRWKGESEYVNTITRVPA